MRFAPLWAETAPGAGLRGQVTWAEPLPGLYRVVVSGRDVPLGPQGWALVVTGDFEAAEACAVAAEWRCPGGGGEGGGQCSKHGACGAGGECVCDAMHVGADCSGELGELVDGVTVTTPEVRVMGWVYYTFTTVGTQPWTLSASNLALELSAGVSDPSVFVAFQRAPTLLDFDGSADFLDVECFSNSSGTGLDLDGWEAHCQDLEEDFYFSYEVDDAICRCLFQQDCEDFDYYSDAYNYPDADDFFARDHNGYIGYKYGCFYYDYYYRYYSFEDDECNNYLESYPSGIYPYDGYHDYDYYDYWYYYDYDYDYYYDYWYYYDYYFENEGCFEGDLQLSLDDMLLEDVPAPGEQGRWVIGVLAKCCSPVQLSLSLSLGSVPPPPPTLAPAPVDRDRVAFMLTLPVSKNAFLSKADAYKRGIAAAAGATVSVDDIFIVAVTETDTAEDGEAGRRAGGTGRRLLSVAVAVETEVVVREGGEASSASVAARIEEGVAAALAAEGLPGGAVGAAPAVQRAEVITTDDGGRPAEAAAAGARRAREAGGTAAWAVLLLSLSLWW